MVFDSASSWGAEKGLKCARPYLIQDREPNTFHPQVRRGCGAFLSGVGVGK